MNKKQQFIKFLEGLKGHGQDSLIESVKQGFQTCLEVISYDDEEEETIDPAPLHKLAASISDYAMRKFQVKQQNDDYFGLWLDGKMITEGDYNHVLERLKGLVREYGIYESVENTNEKDIILKWFLLPDNGKFTTPFPIGNLKAATTNRTSGIYEKGGRKTHFYINEYQRDENNKLVKLQIPTIELEPA